MEPKRMVQIATKMRRKKSFLLDVSELDEKEIAFITVLLKDTEIYNFFAKLQDIPMKKIYLVCKYLEYREALGIADI